jgi:hypothetical protein
MKRSVGISIPQGIAIALGTWLLLLIVQAETVISFLIVIGMFVFTIQQAWTGWRKDRRLRAPAGAGRSRGSR